MRLHSLEITGFGPFAGTQRVDFDDLCADGLFLLHGPTGAGKTTVLDAVAFALYGTVPGARRDGRRLRSDHAAPGVPTEVMLEATISGRTLRIRRSPEYMRPKRRGTGETKEQAHVTLEWLDGSGENLSRIPDVADAVLRLLGMSAEQFFQVVLLPQGEFARFLKAETSARAALLEKLFDTGRFGAVESWFADRRRSGAAEAERARRDVDMATAGLATAAGEELCAHEAAESEPAARDAGGGPDATCAPLPSREDEPVAWADAVRIRAAAAAESAGRDLTDARAAAERARRRADRDRERARAQQRRSEALRTLAEHEAGHPERAEAARELAAARRAEQAGWARRARDEAQRDRDAAAEGVRAALGEFSAEGDEARTALERSGNGAAGTDSAPGTDSAADTAGTAAAAAPAVDVPALTALGRAWDGELVRLEAAAEDAEALNALLSDEDGARKEVEGLADKAAENDEHRGALPDRIDGAQAQLDRSAEADGRLEALRGAVQSASAAEAAAIAVPEVLSACADTRERVTAAEHARNEARAHALDLRAKRLEGMAAELAGELLPDEGCPVCGSAEHPHPARPGVDPVTKEDEEAAARAVDAAAGELDGLRRRLQETETELALHRERAGGLEPAAAGERREAADRALREAERTAQGRGAAQELLDRLRAEARSAQSEAERIARDRRAAEGRAEALRARISDTRARLEETVGRASGIGERAGRLRGLRARLDALLDAHGGFDAACTALRKADDAVRAAAVEGGFDDAASALSAVRSASRCSEIEADLAAAREAAAGAQAVLDEQAVAAEAQADTVDAEASGAAAAEAEKLLEAAVRRQNAASGRLAAVDAQHARVDEAVDALGPVLDAQRWLSDLTDIMLGDGENSRRMSLRSYVLAARLEEVAVVASQRLQTMSSGRYEFVHTEATVKRERRGGLGLDILDANTGAVRPTSTLSGGETFMASLALALGLADVVSEEAGGIQLETLFIDEGFGTLDAESLDMVMGVLDELRAGGRAVGIVSHVAEMRQRIPSRLRIEKTEDGSALRAGDSAAV